MSGNRWTDKNRETVRNCWAAGYTPMSPDFPSGCSCGFQQLCLPMFAARPKMRVLAACEESQAVTIEFRKRGHEAYSCDIIDCSGGHPEWHIKGDVIKHLREVGPGYYDLIASFSPCTYSCNSGVRWLIVDGKLIFDRYEKMVEHCLMFNEFDKYAEKVVKENPIPHKYARAIIGKYDQIIQPHQFGHGETKATCLWLKGLDKLRPTNNVPGREARIHRMPPGPERSKLRSKFLPGFAKAYASQWG